MNLAKLMIPKVSTVVLHENSTVRQGLEVMLRNGYTAIPVLDEEERYVGSITEGDFLRHVLAVGTTDRKAHERYRIGALVRRDFCPALDIAADDEEVISAVLDQNFVPIVDSRKTMCGIVTRRRVLQYLSDARAARASGADSAS